MLTNPKRLSLAEVVSTGAVRLARRPERNTGKWDGEEAAPCGGYESGRNIIRLNSKFIAVLSTLSGIDLIIDNFSRNMQSWFLLVNKNNLMLY
jgi:hypothetical protein